MLQVLSEQRSLHFTDFFSWTLSDFTLKMIWSALVLLLILTAAVSKEVGREDDFINKHVKPNMTPNECDVEMAKINQLLSRKAKKNICKGINTFVLNNIEEIRTVCTNGVRLIDDYFISKMGFNKVECLLESMTGNYCKYKGEDQEGPIYVACKGNHPVHYGAPPNHESKSDPFLPSVLRFFF
ncbi:ribonuclease-like 3 [Hoplias malabaricus]|uniref:ribonuclease-like 3 n=1 Tax=Hoplias malabaricus TaxID=27720 RepID=UPI0034634EA7